MSKYLGTCLVLWGVVLGCTPLAQNFPQLLALRFLQGFFEASAYPCMYIYLYHVKKVVSFFFIERIDKWIMMILEAFNMYKKNFDI